MLENVGRLNWWRCSHTETLRSNDPCVLVVWSTASISSDAVVSIETSCKTLFCEVFTVNNLFDFSKSNLTQQHNVWHGSNLHIHSGIVRISITLGKHIGKVNAFSECSASNRHIIRCNLKTLRQDPQIVRNC